VTDGSNGDAGLTARAHVPSLDATNAPGPHVLIIAAHPRTRLELERSFPEGIPTRSVATPAETEGLGSEVVVVAGDFPIADLLEVRAHPGLHDKPVVLFAPCKDIPARDWEADRAWPVLSEHNALGQLIEHVRHLFVPAGHDLAAPQPVA